MCVTDVKPAIRQALSSVQVNSSCCKGPAACSRVCSLAEGSMGLQQGVHVLLHKGPYLVYTYCDVQLQPNEHGSCKTEMARTSHWTMGAKCRAVPQPGRGNQPLRFRVKPLPKA